ncbi:MAG: hypothetical protein AB8F95_02110 [Bacteroidia bacterium]
MRFIIILIACLCFFSCEEKDPFYLGGIQIHEASQEDWVKLVDDVGMNTIEVTVYAKQGDWNSDNLWWDREEPYVLSEIRAAKAQGLRVVLVLRTALDHAFSANKFLWHGMIMPESDSLLKEWFWRYNRFTIMWADIAEQEGIDVLVIGSELNALSATTPIDTMPALLEYFSNKPKQEKHEKRVLKFKDQLLPEDLWVQGFDNYEAIEPYIDDKIATNVAWAHAVTFGDSIPLLTARRELMNGYWLSVIEEVRKRYGGKLSYAANFDNYHEVGFWDALDFIGINAYFPLRDYEKDFPKDSIPAALAQGWERVFADIDSFKVKDSLVGKPLLFTELGYIYRESCTILPWEGFGFSVAGLEGEEAVLVWKKQPENRIERAMAVEALHKVVVEQQQPLKGILYWKLTGHDYLIKEEPFALHLTKKATDPLQNQLLKFMSIPERKD